MSLVVHFTKDFYSPVCTLRPLKNMTDKIERVTCAGCLRRMGRV